MSSNFVKRHNAIGWDWYLVTNEASSWVSHMVKEHIEQVEAENDRLREQVERLQPKDCEGNVLDIADTVHMLRSEYDGDHEWDDVVVELALTKWGGDRWIVRGSKGEAWACDCSKTGYDEDVYEGSDDAEPIVNPSLIEVENAKLRELVRGLRYCAHEAYGMCARVPVGGERPFTCCPLYDFDAKEYRCEKLMLDLGVGVDG